MSIYLTQSEVWPRLVHRSEFVINVNERFMKVHIRSKILFGSNAATCRRSRRAYLVSEGEGPKQS